MNRKTAAKSERTAARQKKSAKKNRIRKGVLFLYEKGAFFVCPHFGKNLSRAGISAEPVQYIYCEKAGAKGCWIF